MSYLDIFPHILYRKKDHWNGASRCLPCFGNLLSLWDVLDFQGRFHFVLKTIVSLICGLPSFWQTTVQATIYAVSYLWILDMQIHFDVILYIHNWHRIKESMVIEIISSRIGLVQILSVQGWREEQGLLVVSDCHNRILRIQITENYFPQLWKLQSWGWSY